MNLNYKELILGILVAASGIAAFWLWHDALPLIVSGEFASFLRFLAPILVLSLAAALFGLASVLTKDGLFIYAVAAMVASVPYLFTPARGIVLGAVAVSIFLMLSAVHRARKDFTLSLGFSLSKTFRAGVPLYFTFASLIIAIFYLSLLNEETAIPALFPRATLNFTLNRLSEPLSSITGVPKISTDATVDEVLTDLFKEQLKSQGIAFTQIPAEELNLALARERLALQEQYGIKLTGQEKVGDVFYDAITARLQDLLGPYKRYLPLASAIAFFFAFKAVTFPLYYLGLFMGFLLLKGMIASKIIISQKTPIEVERLTL